MFLFYLGFVTVFMLICISHDLYFVFFSKVYPLFFFVFYTLNIFSVVSVVLSIFKSKF